MTTPTNHHLIVTLPNGKPVLGKVVYLQPNEAEGRPQSAVVHSVTSTWLGPGSYNAFYSTPTESFLGRYSLHGDGDAAGQWLLMGTFDRL